MTDTIWSPHLLLAFGGAFWGSEAWECTLKLSQPVGYEGGGDGFCADKLEDAAADVAAWWADKDNGAASHASLDWVKFNSIDAWGHYDNTAVTHQKRYTTGHLPGTPDVYYYRDMPPQVALVLGLRTAHRGPRQAFGRIYMPADGLELESGTPYISAAACGMVASSFAGFLDDLNNWSGIDPPDAPYVVVASKASRYTPKGGGAERVYLPSLTPVTDVWVGNTYDTHRSRARQLRQTYAKVALAA